MSRSDEPAGPPAKLHQVAGAFRERLPVPVLRQHVDRFWINKLDAPAVIEVVPDGCVDIYWTGGRLHIAGPNTRIVTARITGPAELVGARFRPGVAARWLRASATQLLNTHPPLEDLWGGPATARLADELAYARNAKAAIAVLEHALIERLPGVMPADPMISATVAAAAKESRDGIVGRLIGEFGWSERTLRRRCLAAFGYGPKTLQRIFRFQRFLRLLSEGNAPLSALAIDAGYADHAHLAREVRRLSGHTPSSLISELQA